MKPLARKFTIGRNPTCDVPIAEDSVSRLHAELTVLDDGKLSLVDRGSSNGTLLIRQGKTRPIREEILQLTDRIRFGTVELGVNDLLEAIRRKHPDLNIGKVPALGSEGSRLVRCGCGAIKPADGRCPSCGE